MCHYAHGTQKSIHYDLMNMQLMETKVEKELRVYVSVDLKPPHHVNVNVEAIIC